MRRAAIFPLLGPALVLYLVADVASVRGPLDALGYAIAALSFLLSLSFVGAARDLEGGARLTAWLGLSSAVAVTGWLDDGPVRLTVDVAQALAFALGGALVLDSALHVPDRVLATRSFVLPRALPYALGAVAVLASMLALGPVLAPFGTPWLLPQRLAYAPAAFAGVSAGVALSLRLARPRLGSSPEALASNTWAVLGLFPIVLSFGLVLARAFVFVPDSVIRALGAASACLLYGGHLWLGDPRRRLASASVAREVAGVVLTIVIAGSAVTLLAPQVPRSPRAVALATLFSLLFAIALLFVVRPLVRRWLAPARGSLLDQLEALSRRTGTVHSFEDAARLVLAALREASGAGDAQALLYGFDPAFEARIDAAGEPHLESRSLPSPIHERLRAHPGELIVRAPLEGSIVRQPALRPLVSALAALDALCVVPLVVDGELEGALVVPRGLRGTRLTLEESSALSAHARWLSSVVAVFSQKGRAERRAETLLLERRAAVERGERLEDEVTRLRSDVELLHAMRPLRSETPPLIAYAPPMRELVARVQKLVHLDVPLLLWAEAGVALEALARLVHVESGRAAEPFLVLDCARLREDECALALFGGEHEGVQHPGVLRLAGAGTILLYDLPALPAAAQRLLADALASRTCRPPRAPAFTLLARVVASCRVEPAALCDAGRFDTELHARLEPTTLRVPPLRECPQDIASHALLALDRACRRLGRPPMGFEPAALALLVEQPLPDNGFELERIVERAVTRAEGSCVGVQDLRLAADGVEMNRSERNPLEGPLEEIEKRALEHALARTGGNKSEAARLLGLPRTTLIDKIRRHKLEDAPRDTPGTPPN